MPIEKSTLEKDFKGISLYKSDLIWIEGKMLEVISRSVLSIYFYIKEESYTVDTVDELINGLKQWGIQEIERLYFMGLTFVIGFSKGEMNVSLSTLTDKRKAIYYQVVEFLTVKQDDSTSKHKIFLYENPELVKNSSVDILATVKDGVKEVIAESNIQQSVKFVNTEINLTQTESVNPTATIVTGNNKKTSFSLLGKDKSFWLDVLGVVVAIATLIITYLLSKGII